MAKILQKSPTVTSRMGNERKKNDFVTRFQAFSESIRGT